LRAGWAIEKILFLIGKDIAVRKASRLLHLQWLEVFAIIVLLHLPIQLAGDSKVVLKDGTVLVAKGIPIWVNQTFIFAGTDGKAHSIPLNDVDLKATQEANRDGQNPAPDRTNQMKDCVRSVSTHLPQVIYGTTVLKGGIEPARVSGPATVTKNQSVWLRSSGVSAFDNAIRARVSGHKPVAIYFYVNWCPYCKAMEKEILSSPEVRQYLSTISYVAINPEDGANENTLFKRFGGTGYPSFYILSSRSDAPQRVSRNGTPSQFIENCQGAASR
jgi:thiol-disulfide isomerase/thioredoxin